MAVKTDFTQEDFELILSHYNLGEYSSSEPIPQGTVQTNYILRTTRGKYVLRYYEVRSRESVLFESDLLAFLAQRRYPCPRQIENLEGSYLGCYQDRPYLLFEFISGHHLEHPSRDQYRQLIQKAAELQLITEDFRSAYTSQRWNYSPELCRRLAREQAESINTPAARQKLLWLEGELDRLVLPGSLPKGICHCDFHFSNVLFQGGVFTSLLDFDDANHTYTTFDLVGLIEGQAWSRSDEELDLTAAREVVREYQQIRPLQELEKYHLYDVYKLSVLFDAVWYFNRWSGNGFREKRKLANLADLGRNAFMDHMFGSESGVLKKEI